MSYLISWNFQNSMQPNVRRIALAISFKKISTISKGNFSEKLHPISIYHEIITFWKNCSLNDLSNSKFQIHVAYSARFGQQKYFISKTVTNVRKFTQMGTNRSSSSNKIFAKIWVKSHEEI